MRFAPNASGSMTIYGPNDEDRFLSWQFAKELKGSPRDSQGQYQPGLFVRDRIYFTPAETYRSPELRAHPVVVEHSECQWLSDGINVRSWTPTLGELVIFAVYAKEQFPDDAISHKLFEYAANQLEVAGKS